MEHRKSEILVGYLQIIIIYVSIYIANIHRKQSISDKSLTKCNKIFHFGKWRRVMFNAFIIYEEVLFIP